MESLLKQARVRFSGEQSREESGSSKGRIPSFTEDKRRPQNWIRRQFSAQMSQGYDSNEAEQATSIAAAVYVIASIEESSIPETSLTRIKSKKEDKAASVQRRASKELSAEMSAKSPESRDGRVPQTANRKGEAPAQGVAPPIKRPLTSSDEKPAPSMKKIPTSASSGGGVKPEKAAEPKAAQPTVKPEILGTKPDVVTKTKPSTPSDKTEKPTSAPPGVGQTQADTWERDELAKIQKRYEELNARILSWENKKKQKARERLDKTESELAQVRLKATEKFHNKVVNINQIAEAARAQAAERQRNDEFKAKEKANKIRKKGEMPRTFFCF